MVWYGIHKRLQHATVPYIRTTQSITRDTVWHVSCHPLASSSSSSPPPPPPPPPLSPLLVVQTCFGDQAGSFMQACKPCLPIPSVTVYFGTAFVPKYKTRLLVVGDRHRSLWPTTQRHNDTTTNERQRATRRPRVMLPRTTQARRLCRARMFLCFEIEGSADDFRWPRERAS